MSNGSSTYQKIRATHYAQTTLQQRAYINARAGKAAQVHAAITRLAANWGVEQVLANRRQFEKELKRELGVGGPLGFLWGPVITQLITLLLPIFLRWLQEQFSQQSYSGESVKSLDDQLRVLAAEAWE